MSDHNLANGFDTSSSALSETMKGHLRSLKRSPEASAAQEAMSTPLFTSSVAKAVESQAQFTQFGLLAGVTKLLGREREIEEFASSDPRVFFNVAPPSSTFICGSQGSGKSHTLSVLLETCLIQSHFNQLTRPLTGIVFHYDTFTGDESGSPCEAAYLSSHPSIKVRVLCSPTNIESIKRTYAKLKVSVDPLETDETNLNTRRMMDLMALNFHEGPQPLYVHTVTRILRELRIEQQNNNSQFDYRRFKKALLDCDLSPMQLTPLNQRLDTLESFMPMLQRGKNLEQKRKRGPIHLGADWKPVAGQLTIVDLSCPCISAETACSLFNMCLSLFIEQSSDVGKVVALDEAHKYMDKSAEARTFTEQLLCTIRLQRHLAARIIISTQEPTISTDLLDLSSTTIVHRFTSPQWLTALRTHLAPGAASIAEEDVLASSKSTPKNYIESETTENSISKVGDIGNIFKDIVELHVGEALIFAPSAALETDNQADGVLENGMQGLHLNKPIAFNQKRSALQVKQLGFRYVKVKVRERLTEDGGRSITAN